MLACSDDETIGAISFAKWGTNTNQNNFPDDESQCPDDTLLTDVSWDACTIDFDTYASALCLGEQTCTLPALDDLSSLQEPEDCSAAYDTIALVAFSCWTATTATQTACFSRLPSSSTDSITLIPDVSSDDGDDYPLYLGKLVIAFQCDLPKQCSSSSLQITVSEGTTTKTVDFVSASTLYSANFGTASETSYVQFAFSFFPSFFSSFLLYLFIYYIIFLSFLSFFIFFHSRFRFLFPMSLLFRKRFPFLLQR
jgi:hypothetical protein